MQRRAGSSTNIGGRAWRGRALPLIAAWLGLQAATPFQTCLLGTNRPACRLDRFAGIVMSKSDTLRYGPPGDSAVHLCVDMQRMFAEGTDWKMPWLEHIPPNIVAIFLHILREASSRALSLPRSPGTALACGDIIMSAGRP